MNRIAKATIIGIVFSSSLFGSAWEHNPDELQKNLISLPKHPLVLLDLEYDCYHKIFFSGKMQLTAEDRSNLQNLIASFYRNNPNFKRNDWQEPPVSAAEFKRLLDIGQIKGRSPGPTRETSLFEQLRQNVNFRRWAGKELVGTIDAMQNASDVDLIWEQLYQRFDLQFFTDQTCDAN